MSGRKRATDQLLHGTQFKRTQHLCRVKPQVFRFGELPLEIRQQIYRRCLIHNTSIPIAGEKAFYFHRNGYDEAQVYDNHEFLHVDNPQSFTINPNVLLVNSTIHNEANFILYGLNTFKFSGRYSWIYFYHFGWRLTKTSRQLVRKIVIDFPIIERDLSTSGRDLAAGRLNRVGEVGLIALKECFWNLGSLTFYVSGDLMSGDYELLRKIWDSCALRCQVVLVIRPASVFHDNQWRRCRAVRISSGILGKMRNWGWKVEGEFELVDQGHHLSNEREWRQWLQKNMEIKMLDGLVV